MIKKDNEPIHYKYFKAGNDVLELLYKECTCPDRHNTIPLCVFCLASLKITDALVDLDWYIEVGEDKV